MFVLLLYLVRCEFFLIQIGLKESLFALRSVSKIRKKKSTSTEQKNQKENFLAITMWPEERVREQES